MWLNGWAPLHVGHVPTLSAEFFSHLLVVTPGFPFSPSHPFDFIWVFSIIQQIVGGIKPGCILILWVNAVLLRRNVLDDRHFDNRQKPGELSKQSPWDSIMAVLKNALHNHKIRNLVILFIIVMPIWLSSLFYARDQNKIKVPETITRPLAISSEKCP